VAGVVGLATLLLAGTAMVLAPLWDPDAAALAIVAAAGAVHLAALPSALADSPRSDTRAPTFAINPSSAAMLVGTSLWLGAAVFTPPIVPGIGGFPARITPLWHVGVVLVLFALVFAWRERQERYAALAVGSLMLALTLTPGLVYGMPRAQTAGKHVELVQLVLRSHHLRAGDGIYFAYSGFFDGIAWLCRVARVPDATGLATFWPALVGLLKLAELRFLFGRVIEERYRLWLAIALVVLVDAIGADYFSPQSVGYVLGLGIFALALAPGGRRALDPRLAAVLIILSGCALAVTHQLSPYIVGGVLLVLAAFGCVRPRWAGLAILVPAGLWALLNRHALEGYFSLSSLGRISNFAPPHTAAAPGLSRDSIVGRSSNALTIGLAFLIAVALVGFARHRHERWARAFLISAGVGLVLVTVNPYGNEGIFRAALFGIPWLAILAAHAVRQANLLLVARWVALSLALFPTFLIAQFGMDASGVMRQSDLHALRVFEREAPPTAYLLQVGFGDLPNGPPNLPPTKHQIPFERVSFRSGLLPGRPDAGDLATLIRRYERRARGEIGDRAGPFYVLWSPVTAWYGREYGLETPAQTARWRDLLLASPSWRVVYRDGGSYLFREDESTRHGGPSP
jgi:hypothetical protein